MEKSKRLPLPQENPKGLHGRYFIQKIKGVKRIGEDFFYNPIFEPVLEDVSDDAEYFVLRLDKNGKDPIHIAACRRAIMTYAEEIKNHIPQLSKDLIDRYA